jgi:photosynthetic reaction center cytochrome c subunit
MLSVAIIAVAQAAQAPATPPGGPAPHRGHHFPAPTNLKVLPKDLTGDKVHEIMEQWALELGVHCRACHAENPKDIGPNGRPRLDYANDSKEEKKTARVMYGMVENINVNYIANIESSGDPVTCGTCHRGSLSPESFDGSEDHPSPPAGTKPPAAH